MQNSLGVNLYAELYGSDIATEEVLPPNNALVDDSDNYILYNGAYILYG